MLFLQRADQMFMILAYNNIKNTFILIEEDMYNDEFYTLSRRRWDCFSRNASE